MDFGEIFIEQAEFLSTLNLVSWSAEHPRENLILKKLCGPGAHLITGPRGCGKTTLLLKAFKKTIYNRKTSSFPIYVNYKLSLKLEPLYSETTNAVYWFNQWLIAKIYEGLYESLKELKISKKKNLSVSELSIKGLITKLELGASEFGQLSDYELDSNALDQDILSTLDFIGKNRCILLLDDAAHAFSPQQQRDFFDFFRKIRNRYISPKAAIYPGVTSLSPSFHLGHDAEEIDVWISPDEKEYLPFMFSLLQKRLPEEIYNKLNSNLAGSAGSGSDQANMLNYQYKNQIISYFFPLKCPFQGQNQYAKNFPSRPGRQGKMGNRLRFLLPSW